MAMIIVLTAAFVVLATIGVGAAMIASNLDKISSGINHNKADSNLQIAYEKLRGIYKVTPTFLDACSGGDCVSLTNSNCVSCTDPTATYTNGDLKYKVKINSITQPNPLEPSAGSLVLDTTGYYKGLAKIRSFTMCLNYCAVSGRNCDSNGCGGVCGTCVEPQTCGGGGSEGVCGGGGTCPNDVNVECDGSCVEGESCGGGRVIDRSNHIVATGGGCEDTSGSSCGRGNPDSLTRVWNQNTGVSGATNADDGRENARILREINGTGIIPEEYEAVKFCEDLSSNSFEDWYLPAQNELNALYNAWQSGWAADFAADKYWSSTERASKESFFTDFSGGAAGYVPKDQQWYIRCVRRY